MAIWDWDLGGEIWQKRTRFFFPSPVYRNRNQFFFGFVFVFVFFLSNFARFLFGGSEFLLNEGLEIVRGIVTRKFGSSLWFRSKM